MFWQRNSEVRCMSINNKVHKAAASSVKEFQESEIKE